MTNLYLSLAESARRNPEAVAVTLGERSLSHAELDSLTGRGARMLRDDGILPGDRVAIMLANSIEFVVLYYAALRVGAIVVPMNPLLKAGEIEHYVGDAGAAMLFVNRQSAVEAKAAGFKDVSVLDAECFVAMLEGIRGGLPAVHRADDATALILYTSGTTGRPKGAELTHANLRHNSAASAARMGLTGDDVLLGALPLFHVFGLVCLLGAAIEIGGRLALVERFEPEPVLDVMAGQGVTVFVGVPTMFLALLNIDAAVERTSTLRLAVSGGAPMPVPLLARFEATFPIQILEGYGLSETSPICTINRPGDGRRIGSVGTAIAGVQLRIADEQDEILGTDEVGEIQVRGHNVMRGYWRRPVETAEVMHGDWLATGDLGRIDADGYLFIAGRKKELIIRGGYNVYPREIEEALLQHPSIVEVSVVGL